MRVAIGRARLIELRWFELAARRSRSWRPVHGCERSLKRSSSCGGHRNRSRVGWWASSPTTRRCACGWVHHRDDAQRQAWRRVGPQSRKATSSQEPVRTTRHFDQRLAPVRSTCESSTHSRQVRAFGVRSAATAIFGERAGGGRFRRFPERRAAQCGTVCLLALGPGAQR